MTEYMEAKRIALELNSKFNGCVEYEKGYHFFVKNDEEVIGDAGCVVIKETGEALTWMSFIDRYEPEKNPKAIEF